MRRTVARGKYLNTVQEEEEEEKEREREREK
jgi:hypothetical protein